MIRDISLRNTSENLGSSSVTSARVGVMCTATVRKLLDAGNVPAIMKLIPVTSPLDSNVPTAAKPTKQDHQTVRCTIKNWLNLQSIVIMNSTNSDLNTDAKLLAKI